MTDDATVPPGAEPDPELTSAGASADLPQPPRRLRLIAVVGLVAVVLDQLTKTWAEGHLKDGPRHLVGTLQLQLLHNTGVAFSQGSGKGLGPYISILALVVVISVSLGSTSRTTVGAVASGLISGGAVGNLADRAFRGSDGFLHGAVVDFIDLQWWPVFNVADAAIVVGAILLVIASLRPPGTGSRPTQAAASPKPAP